MDELYIKMILALPNEFFEGWEFNNGDQVYLIEEIDDYSPSKDYGLYTVFDGLLANEGLLITENLHVSVIDFKNGRPILSQEQLQRIVIDFENKDNPHSRSNDFSISERFIALVIEGDLVQNIESKTLKEMWLEFVMYLIYEKVWDGNSWVGESWI